MKKKGKINKLNKKNERTKNKNNNNKKKDKEWSGGLFVVSVTRSVNVEIRAVRPLHTI